jgi:hypothetical protein
MERCSHHFPTEGLYLPLMSTAQVLLIFILLFQVKVPTPTRSCFCQEITFTERHVMVVIQTL